MTSLYDYRYALRINAEDGPFYGIIMGAMLKADSKNVEKLKAAWPEVWEELRKRYNTAGGVLVKDLAPKIVE